MWLDTGKDTKIYLFASKFIEFCTNLETFSFFLFCFCHGCLEFVKKLTSTFKNLYVFACHGNGSHFVPNFLWRMKTSLP